MELGIYDGTGALTQQQRVLAAQAEIMAQTAVAQGDFARTSGGLAGQQRILSAGLENLSASFGELLLPVAVAVVGILNTAVVPALQGVVELFSAGAPRWTLRRGTSRASRLRRARSSTFGSGFWTSVRP